MLIKISFFLETYRRDHCPARTAVDAAVHVAAGVSPESIVCRHENPAMRVGRRRDHHSVSVSVDVISPCACLRLQLTQSMVNNKDGITKKPRF